MAPSGSGLSSTPWQDDRVTEPLLPDTTSDEREVGWGDDVPDEDRERDDDEHFNAERPPHHDRD